MIPLDLAGWLAALVAGLVAWLMRMRAKSAEKERDELQGYAKTRKEMDDAMEGLPRDPAAARDWLRERMRQRKP